MTNTTHAPKEPELCDGFPPVNAAFLGTVQCGDHEVESWCCK